MMHHTGKKIVLQIGDLHVVMAMLRIIEAAFEGSGMEEVFMQIDIYGSATLRQILTGTHVSRAVEAHIYEPALWCYCVGKHWQWRNLSWNWKSYCCNLSPHSFSVLASCFTSPPYPLSCAIPQGSVLGPILFNMFTTPLSTLISS